MLTWSFCPCRSQVTKEGVGEREDLPHLGSLKWPPFWQRAEQFDKEPSPPQAGLKFHHMGSAQVLPPGGASLPVPGLPDPTGPSQPCLSQVAWLHGSASVPREATHEPWVTVAKQQAMSQGAWCGRRCAPWGVGWGGKCAGF